MRIIGRVAPSRAAMEDGDALFSYHLRRPMLVTHPMRPAASVLAAAAFATALHSLLNQQSKLPYRLDMDEEFRIEDPTVAMHLYRITREAVINANKHAGAGEIIVRVHSGPKAIELSVTDDGIGISPNSGKGPGLGFHIMEYRARSIGARLEIKRLKPHGTRVSCYSPRK